MAGVTSIAAGQARLAQECPGQGQGLSAGALGVQQENARNKPRLRKEAVFSEDGLKSGD